MKQWKYPKQCVVRINENARKGMKFTVDLYAVVFDHLKSSLYDYEVLLEDGSHGKYKEEELDYFFKVGDTLQVMNGGEKGKVVTFDIKHKQLELNHEDKSYKVYLFSQVITVDEDDFVMEKINEINEKEMSETSKLTNAELHKSILETLHRIYLTKNADYGNSFEEQFKEYGKLSGVIRIDDKVRRLKQLLKQLAQVKNESFEDTLYDLANYSIMLLMELIKEKEGE